MDFIEKLKLKLRAKKYRTRHDIGGIEYILTVVRPGSTVMDIGAHKGGYLYFFQQQATEKGKIFAFEPQSALYQYLIKIKRIFGWKNITIEHLAISDAPGKVTLYIPSNKKSTGTSPGATIVQSERMEEYGTREEVTTVTLDEYCRLNRIKPDFLKIDVEGNELRIFNGGQETLKNYKPKILVEIEARHIGEQQVKKTWQFLLDRGYKGYFIHGREKYPVDAFKFSTHQNLADMPNYCNNFIFE